jgi:tRNA (guanine-N7-)-methyltransferase
MKAKDFTIPFSFAERRPYLASQFFYVPVHFGAYDQFVLPSFCELFENSHPVYIEYCSGNGDWVVEQARHHPEQNWIAVEKRLDRVQKIWIKLHKYQLKNLLIVCGEAYTFTRYYLAAHTIEGAFIHFPDPWPKTCHAKHRLLQPAFSNELSRILVQERGVTCVSDDLIYLKQAINIFQSHPCFKPALPAPFFRTEDSSYGGSWFENLWREKGRQIHSTYFVKHAHPL